MNRSMPSLSSPEPPDMTEVVIVCEEQGESSTSIDDVGAEMEIMDHDYSVKENIDPLLIPQQEPENMPLSQPATEYEPSNNNLSQDDNPSDVNLVQGEITSNMNSTQNARNTNMNLIRIGTNSNMNLIRIGTNSNMNLIRNGTNPNMNIIRNATNTNMNLIRVGTNSNMNLIRNGTNSNMNLIRNATNTNMNLIRIGTNSNMNLIRNGTNSNMNLTRNATNTNINLIPNGTSSNINLIRNGTNSNTNLIQIGTNSNINLNRNGTNSNTNLIRIGTNSSLNLNLKKTPNMNQINIINDVIINNINQKEKSPNVKPNHNQNTSNMNIKSYLKNFQLELTKNENLLKINLVPTKKKSNENSNPNVKTINMVWNEKKKTSNIYLKESEKTKITAPGEHSKAVTGNGSSTQIRRRVPDGQLRQTLTQTVRKLKLLRKRLKQKNKIIRASKCILNNPHFLKLLDNMSSVAKTFIIMQMRECSKFYTGRRFTLEEKLIALSIMKQNPAAYRFLRNIFILPQMVTLERFENEIQLHVVPDDAPNIDENNDMFVESYSAAATLIELVEK